MDRDLYEILQVHPSAEQEVIDGAYNRLARKYHPDVNKSPDATRRMQEINLAYEILRNPAKRAVYDATWAGHSSQAKSGHKSENQQRREQAQARQSEEKEPSADVAGENEDIRMTLAKVAGSVLLEGITEWLKSQQQEALESSASNLGKVKCKVCGTQNKSRMFCSNCRALLPRPPTTTG